MPSRNNSGGPRGPSPRQAGLQEQMRRHFASEGPWQEAREGEFEMMDVSVTVLGLSGITSEAVKTKKHRRASSNTGGGGGTNSHGHGGSGGPPRSRSGSRTAIGASSSSGEYSDADIPVTAVASFFKNVTSNKTSIGTHLPSLALGMPTSSFGNTSRYMASWPSPASASSRPLMAGGGRIGNASFKFSRVMRRHAVDGSWDGEDDIAEGAGGGNGVFTHETMDILVGLARGSDMIPLGVATLVITGEEMGEVQVNLPVKTGSDALASMMNAINLKKKKKNKGNKSKIFQSLAKGAKNSKKGAFFKVAPGARYRLDENAALRLVVKAQPRNGGYDVDGSVVSGLSCPTGSSEGSSSESSSSESEDDYDNEYEEEQGGKEERPLPVSRQSSGPSVPSYLGATGSKPAGLPPKAGQPYNPRIPPMQSAADQYHSVHPNTMLDPHMHQHHQPNVIPNSPRYHVKTHMMEQQMHQQQQQLMMQQQRKQQGLGLQLPYDGPLSHGGHPHFDIPPVASEASTEPGYGDEFEGMVGNQAEKPERKNDPSSIPPIKMKGKSRSNHSRETVMTTPISSEDLSGRFMASPRQNACEPLSAILSCGAMKNLCIDDDEDKPPKRRKKKPPVTNIFADECGNKMSSRKNRRKGGKEEGGGRRSRHDEYDENTILSSESETDVSMGTGTFQDMEATRLKLRAYAGRMGLDPEQLV